MHGRPTDSDPAKSLALPLKSPLVLPGVAGTASVFASLTSALVGLPLVARTSRDRQLPQQLAWSIGLVIALGMIGAVLRHIF